MILRKLPLVCLILTFEILAHAQTQLVNRNFNPSATCSDPATYLINQMNPSFTPGWYKCVAGHYQAVTIPDSFPTPGPTPTPAASPTPGGSDTQVQFNDGNAFGGNSGFLFDKTVKHSALGNQATVDSVFLYPSLVFREPLIIAESLTSLTNGVNYGSFEGALELDPTANNTAGIQGISQDVWTKSGNTKNFSGITATNLFVYHQGSGTIAGAYGVLSSVDNGATGNIANAYGGDFFVENDSSGGITNSYGLRTSGITNFGSGTITNVYGLQIRAPINSGGGDILNNYGVNIQDQSAFGSILSYNLFSKGIASRNKLEGTLEAGTNSSNNSVLSVNPDSVIIAETHGSGTTASSVTLSTQSIESAGTGYAESSLAQTAGGGGSVSGFTFRSGVGIVNGSDVVLSGSHAQTNELWQPNTHVSSSTNLTNSTSTLVLSALQIGTLSTPLRAGITYSFNAKLFVEESVAAEGIALDFSGGTATFTGFQAYAIGFDTGGFVFRSDLTSAATTFGAATITGPTFVEVSGTFIINAAGTVAVRVAQNAHTIGTVTLKAGSFVLAEQTTTLGNP